MCVTTIGTTMIQLLQEKERNTVMWGDADVLDDAYRLSGAKARGKYLHPLNRWQRVMNALDRDSRFEKGYIRIDVFRTGNRLVRVFKLKPKDK